MAASGLLLAFRPPGVEDDGTMNYAKPELAFLGTASTVISSASGTKLHRVFEMDPAKKRMSSGAYEADE